MDATGRSRRDFLATGAAAAAWPAFSSLASAATAPADLTGLTLQNAAALVRSRTVSPVELTGACLTRIDALNPKVNAYITITRELAMQQAREMEAEQRRGQWRGPLHGVPMAQGQHRHGRHPHHRRQRAVQGPRARGGR